MSPRELSNVWRKIGVKSATLVIGVGIAASATFAEPQSEPAGTAVANAVALRATLRERAFWMCDYVATTRGMPFTPVRDCAQVTDELKEEKFGSDYGAMLQWWRERKPAEHLRLELEEKQGGAAPDFRRPAFPR